MADGYLLSEGDRRKIQDLIAAQQPRALHPTGESDMPYSPDVYVALPQPSGSTPGTIPALTKGSSSTDPDHPGFALCTIYQVVDGTSSSYDLQPISDLTYMVFNTSTATLTGYIVVARAKDGTWLVVSSPGLTAFELKDDVDPAADGPFDAWSLTWDSTSNTYNDPDYESDPDLQLYDDQSKFRALGYDSRPSDEPGAGGFCTSDGVIVEVHETARRIKGTTPTGTSPTVTGTGTFTLHDVAVTDDGISPLTGSATTLTVTNNGSIFASGATVQLRFDSSIPGYLVCGGQQMSRMVRGSNSAAAAGATYTLTIMAELDGGASPGWTVSVTNYNCNLGASADQTTAVFDGTTWRTLDGPCATAGACPKS